MNKFFRDFKSFLNTTRWAGFLILLQNFMSYTFLIFIESLKYTDNFYKPPSNKLFQTRVNLN